MQESGLQYSKARLHLVQPWHAMSSSRYLVAGAAKATFCRGEISFKAQ